MWSILEKHNINLPLSVIRSDHLNMKEIDYLITYIENINHLPDHHELNKKFNPQNIDNFPIYKSYMDKWINLSLSRHIEFQEKLKIKDDQVRNYENFDKNKTKIFTYEFNKNDDLIVLSDETEQEIKTDSDDSLLAKKENWENKKKLLAQKVEDEKKKKELLAQKAEDEKEKELLAQKAEDEKRKELLAQKAKDEKEKRITSSKKIEIKTEVDTIPPTIITAENVIVKSSSGANWYFRRCWF